MDLEHERILTEAVDRSKSNQHRLDKVEKRQDDFDKLLGTVQALAIREARVENDVKEIKNDVKNLVEKPGKRWDSIVEAVLLAIVSAIMLYILARLGF